MPRKPRIDVTERALSTPADVLADPRYRARLANPFGEPSAPVHLKDRSRRARWFNAAIVQDKVWRAKNKGWDPIREEDLVDPSQIGFYGKSPEGFVTRGERGQEILMSIPEVVYKAIEKAKTEYNLRNFGSPTKMKNEVVEAAGRELGDEAADFINRRVGPVGGVTDQYERIERRDEE